MHRKEFIQALAAFTGLAGAAASCKPPRTIPGRITGASAHIGHRLRDEKQGDPVSEEHTGVVIVGAGVSGLSAAYHLAKAGRKDVVLLDLESTAGGNAVHGSNAVSAYPMGAHYVPIPNNALTEYLAFLQETGVVAGWDEKGLPVYNEYHLCFDPEERLYINGRWQEGLIPQYGVPQKEGQEIQRFLAMMDDFRHRTGVDGREAFALPVDASSKDEAFTKLDGLTMKDWLQQHSFNSTYLHWYVDYCTRDDFGTPYDRASAWAGIHYFACRKGKAGNAHHSDVLTWPEGNGFLVNALQKHIKQTIRLNALVTSVSNGDRGVVIDYYDVKAKLFRRINAEHCVLAVPQFVAARLLHDEQRSQTVRQHLQYVPWAVANLTVGKLEERTGASMSWDNVLYGSKSLGYVQATHQSLQRELLKRNLTYYLPLTEQDTTTARKTAQQRSHAEWAEMVLLDLEKVHPNIRDAVEEINISLWGHAMPQPLPGLIHGGVREKLAAPVGNIHFAHTDLSGISLFEEGFYQGLRAAQHIAALLDKQPNGASTKIVSSIHSQPHGV